MRQVVRTALVWLLLPILASSWLRSGGVSSMESGLHLARIRESAVLRFVVEPKTEAAFEHGGALRGFEYDLLAKFCDDLGVSLDVVEARTRGDVVRAIESGAADVAFLDPEEMPSALVALAEHVPRASASVFPTWTHRDEGALAVPREASALRVAFEAFLRDPERLPAIEALRERYLVNYRRFRILEVAAFPRISPYDDLISAHAAREGFDWRFVSALIEVESNFRPDAESEKGAAGLMQIMPVHVSLAESVAGDTDLFDPETNVATGLRYLSVLSRRFETSRGEDHLATVLAAYLLGPGHVYDARRLALDRGLDPDRWWGGLDEVIDLLGDPEIAALLPHGFAHGEHAREYVERIFRRYRQYRSLV